MSTSGVSNATKYLNTAGVAEVRQWHGAYHAKVTSTADPQGLQRVQMNVPQVLGSATSNWAVPAFPLTAAPPVGSIVLAQFLGGDINRPMYMLTPASAPNGVSIKATDISLNGTSLNTTLASIQSQISALLSGNVTIGGTLTVDGVIQAHSDVHVNGDLYGTGGTLTIGDAVDISSNPLTADGTITSHTNLNCDGNVNCDGTVFAGVDVNSSGRLLAVGNITTSGGNVNGIKAQFTNTTGNFGGGGAQGGAVSTFDIGVQARLNDLLAALG